MKPHLSRVTTALLAAMFVAGLLAARSFGSFAPTRVKLLRTSAAAVSGSVAVSGTEPAINALRVPFAAIVRVKNDTDARGTFRLEIDGQALCHADVPGRTSRRLDCVVSDNWSPHGAHRLVVTSATTDWSVEYVELASHFGMSHGLVDLYVLPADAAVAAAGRGWIAGTLAAVFCLLLGVRPARWRLGTRVAHGVLVALAVVVFAGVWIAPWVSIYRVVLSPGTVLRLTAVILAPRLWKVVVAIWRQERVQLFLHLPLARQFTVALLVAAAFGLVMRSRLDQAYGGNYSGFLTVARDNFDRHPALNQRADIRGSLLLQDGGYDAQFMYFAVFDPFIRAYRDTPKRYGEFIDFPPYRYSRIGFVLLTKAVSFDQWRRYPAAMIGLILFALFAASFILARIAHGQGASAWWGATVLLVPGFWRSLLSGLPEPLAVAWLLGGYLALTRKRWGVAGTCFAASLLTRETDVVIIFLLLAWDFFSGRRREAFLAGILTVAPLAAWRIYVGLTFFPDWGWHAFFPTPDDLDVPFKGFVDLWHVVARGAYAPVLAEAALYFPLLLVAGSALAIAFAIRRPSPLALANLFYASIALSFSYGAVWLHVGNAERITCELFVLLALCSIEFWRVRGMRWAISCFWAGSALYVSFGTYDAFGIHDADFMRRALLPFL